MTLGDDPSMPAGVSPDSRQRLAERDGVFFDAVQQAGLPMIVTDPRQADDPVVFANDAFLRMTGYSVDEILGRNCRFMQGPQTDARAIGTIRRAIRERESVTVELVNYRRDGTPFWNALFLSPVFGSNGELLYYFGSQLDVTRQRAAETASHRARRMDAVGQLTSGIAHDFNNLLMVIAGNLELMERADRPERRERLSARMREAVARAQRLTRQLLAFARRQQLELRAMDLNGLLSAMVEPMRRTLGSAVELDMRLDPDLAPCFADPGQVEVALVNLLLNARDAMPNGGAITVTTGRTRLGPDAPEVAAGELPAGDYISLVVADGGTGMPPDVLDRATEPFFTTKQNGPGSGLGLSTVYGFARQSRGHLLLRSEPGRGTSVRLLFPSFVHPGDARDAPRGEERVLLVHSDPAARDATTDLLESLGYSVIRAGSAPQALALLESGTQADLLLVDAAAGRGDEGRALASEARRRRAGLPVLLAIAPADMPKDPSEAERFFTIPKPFGRVELARRLRESLAPGGAG